MERSNLRASQKCEEREEYWKPSLRLRGLIASNFSNFVALEEEAPETPLKLSLSAGSLGRAARALEDLPTCREAEVLSVKCHSNPLFS